MFQSCPPTSLYKNLLKICHVMWFVHDNCCVFQDRNLERTIGHAGEWNDLYCLEDPNLLNSGSLFHSFIYEFMITNKENILFYHYQLGHNVKYQKLTTISFPAFSGFFPNFMAAAAAAPDEIPICKRSNYIINMRTNNLNTWIQISIELAFHRHNCIETTVKSLRATNYHCHTNKPSFKARSLAVSIASSLEICSLQTL